MVQCNRHHSWEMMNSDDHTCRPKQTYIIVFANSIDADETARNEPSHQDLHCLPFSFWLLMGTFVHLCNSGHVQIQSKKRPFQ